MTRPSEAQRWRRTVRAMSVANVVLLVVTTLVDSTAGVAMGVGWVSAWLLAVAVVGFRDACRSEEERRADGCW